MEKITRLQPCLDQIDGLKCNRLEAATLLDCAVQAAPDQLVASLHQRGIDTVLVSLGAEGVHLGRSGRQTYFPLPHRRRPLPLSPEQEMLLLAFCTASAAA